MSDFFEDIWKWIADNGPQIGTALILVAFFGCVIILPFLGSMECNKVSMENEWEVRSLSIGEKVEGSFFLGCGNIDGHSYYYTYIVKDGGIIMKELRTTDTIIYETDDQKPKLERWRVENYETEYRIYVPTDTVKKDFNVDVRGGRR